MNDDDPWVDEIAGEILDHLRENPDAADTRDGVLAGWILQSRFFRGIAALDKALERLVAARELEATRLPDGRILFRRPVVSP